jgi:RES domain-containing protein
MTQTPQDQYFSAKDISDKVVIEIDRVVAQQVKKITPKEYNVERMIDMRIAEMVRSHAIKVTQQYRADVLEKKMEDLVDAEVSRQLSERRIAEYIDRAIHTKVADAIGGIEQSILDRVMRAKFVDPKTRYIKEFHEIMSNAITEAYRKD